MEGKIALFDANGTAIGETFMRRARQLVKQQRADWADDARTAIQFYPDTEEVPMPGEFQEESSGTRTEGSYRGFKEPISGIGTERTNALYAIAEKRVAARRSLFFLTVFFVPVAFAIFIIFGFMSDGFSPSRILTIFFFGVSSGAWLMYFICRVREFFRHYGSSALSDTGIGNYFETRRVARLVAEVERLKRMGYTE